MNKDVYGILGDLTAEILLEIIAECMDDYLYVFDLKNNKMEISQSALDRFMISETHMRNVKQEIMSVVYKEDRTMFAKHMQAVMDGKERCMISITGGSTKRASGMGQLPRSSDR